MTVNDLMPNWSIVLAPQNWLLVAFSTLLLALILHLAFRDGTQGETN